VTLKSSARNKSSPADRFKSDDCINSDIVVKTICYSIVERESCETKTSSDSQIITCDWVKTLICKIFKKIINVNANHIKQEEKECWLDYKINRVVRF
jgi:hypothetical protein